jgi:ribosome maturation factor RimP
MQLVDFIKTTVEGLGYELVDFETSPRGRLLRVFIDRPESEPSTRSSVGVDDCAAVSNQLSRVLTVENIDFDRLEVSSPGLDRPLVKSADYRRFAGCEIQLKLRVPQGNQRNFSGVLVGIEGEEGAANVCLKVDETMHRFALDNVDRARLVPKF